jgi:hypothetical protein
MLVLPIFLNKGGFFFAQNLVVSNKSPLLWRQSNYNTSKTNIMLTTKKHLYNLAQELSNIAEHVEGLEALQKETQRIKDLQAKALVFCMGELDMTFSEMLDAAALKEKEALFTDEEDVLPTPAEMQELNDNDSTDLTDEQKQWYYASTTFNQSIDPENC